MTDPRLLRPHTQDALWSALLASNKLDEYLIQNRSALLSAYSLTASFLDSHDIAYRPASAGHFLAIDLSPYLGPSPASASATTAGEVDLMNRLVNAGVYIGPGYCYRFAGKGTFRLTFSLRREWLAEGLRRMERVLGLEPSKMLEGL